MRMRMRMRLYISSPSLLLLALVAPRLRRLVDLKGVGFSIENIVVEANKAGVGENKVQVLESLRKPEALKNKVVSITVPQATGVADASFVSYLHRIRLHSCPDGEDGRDRRESVFGLGRLLDGLEHGPGKVQQVLLPRDTI